MSRPSRRPSGFTLIELMTVTAIIGVLSSLAIPAYTMLTLRSRAAERRLVMASMKRGITALYIRDGEVNETGGLNPASLPGPAKLAFDNDIDASWAKLTQLVQLEGAMYYQYEFVAAPAGTDTAATLSIHSIGDLDGDGNPSHLTINYERREGQYWTDEGDTTNTWCVTEPVEGGIEGGGLDAGTF